MSYVLSILILAVLMTAWGYAFSKWRHGHGGCCGSCGSPRGDRGEQPTCREDDSAKCRSDDRE